MGQYKLSPTVQQTTSWWAWIDAAPEPDGQIPGKTPRRGQAIQNTWGMIAAGSTLIILVRRVLVGATTGPAPRGRVPVMTGLRG